MVASHQKTRNVARIPSKPSSDEEQGRLIVRKRTYSIKTSKWGSWEVLLRGPARKLRAGERFRARQHPKIIDLRRGGRVRVFPNLVSIGTVENVKKELLNCKLFRQYRIQGNNEPRAHFLLHQAANDDFNSPQPGYRYGTITMKARPLGWLPQLKKLAVDMAKVCDVDYFNLGINPVCYRGGQDKIGDHADNDQGEQKIITAMVDSPPETRKVTIKPNKKLQLEDGDEELEIFVEPGDVYEMDGDMQDSYVHGVPSVKNQIDHETKRIAIVFRYGEERFFQKDTGKSVTDLSPRDVTIKYNFGRNIQGLEEGALYTRNELRERGYHSAQQRGISGNIQQGCDAIIVSGAREDGLGDDRFHFLTYAAETRLGAGAILKNFHANLPIRVFRGSGQRCEYRACSPTKSKAATMYRYDGLYDVVGVDPPDMKEGPYLFHLCRAVASTTDRTNLLNSIDFIKHCLEKETMSRECYYLLSLFEDLDLLRGLHLLISMKYTRVLTL